MRIRWRFQIRKLALRVFLFAFLFYFVFSFGIYRWFVPARPVELSPAVVAPTKAMQTPRPVKIVPPVAFKPIPGTYQCPELTPHDVSRETFTFLPVGPDDDSTLVFSAFFDERNIDRPVVRVIGVSDNANEYYCLFSYEHDVLMSKAELHIIEGGHGRR